jgi:hypothetical protein
MARNRPTTEPTPPAELTPEEIRCAREIVARRGAPDGPPAPAPAVPRHGRLVPAPDTPLSECPTNLDLSRPDHKALAFNALSAADVTVTDRRQHRVHGPPLAGPPGQSARPRHR